MPTNPQGAIYDDLNVRRIVNAWGSSTIMGGSTLDPRIQAAVADANAAWVDMEELFAKSGAIIAGILGAEAALVTSGAFAATVVGVAGIMTGADEKRIAQLPDSSGMRNEFVTQACMPNRYAQAIAVAGGRLIEAGEPKGATPEDLEKACSPRTAGFFYSAFQENQPGIVPLEQVVAIARRKGLPVYLDSAGEIFPLERMRFVAGQSGADLACFGVKYFGGPNSTGILCGKKALVEAAALNNFQAFESRRLQNLGRGYKVDRQEIVAVVVALKLWFAMDHEARQAEEDRRIETIAQALADVAHAKVLPAERRGAWRWMHIAVDEAKLGKTAPAVRQALFAGEPGITLRAEPGKLTLLTNNLKPGETEIVAKRLRQELA